MTTRLRLTWPDAGAFAGRGGRPIRLLAVSDEVDPSLESEATRRGITPVDAVIGCGDLEPPYLGFLADAFGAPLHYVRGNHDVGRSWAEGERELPDPLPDGRVVTEDGLRLLGFSGSPRYAPYLPGRTEQQVSAGGMWWRVLRALPGALPARPLLLVTHAAPRGLNDAPDEAHRGFGALRWLVDRVRPPLWLHGHTALVRRGLDDRTVRHDGTLLVNVTGAVVIDLCPPHER
ncbi:MAG TPA: metallophosphoesterase [candidate division Zixibacteria bacterium]|nr:metallophosphoesterase [candidate division Zixibacteria bacterium]